MRARLINERRDGPSDGNPHVREMVQRGELQTLVWAYERASGTGRGFGFTGGHFHQNWGNDDFRRIVLNAILWLAHMEVPAGGVKSTVTGADLRLPLWPRALDSPSLARFSHCFRSPLTVPVPGIRKARVLPFPWD